MAGTKEMECEYCGGTLAYNKESKDYVCLYCGSHFAAQESQDELYTINNTAMQVIVDCANRQLGSAAKSLSECERVDSRNTATLIARICYRVIKFVERDADSQEEANTLKKRLASDYKELLNRDKNISAEEKNLYEFINTCDSAPDAFAVLLSTFSIFNDEIRVKYFLDFINLEKITSRACNREVLGILLSRNMLDEAKKIINNKNNIEPKVMLSVILNKCPDSPQKVEMAKELIQNNAFTVRNKDKMKAYLQSGDSIKTKCTIIGACAGKEILPGLHDFIDNIFYNADDEDLENFAKGMFDGKLPDNDLYTVLGYALEADLNKSQIILSELTESGQAVAINGRMIESIIMNNNISTDEKIAKWNLIKNFDLNLREVEKTYANYLCEAQDEPENRMKILTALGERTTKISPVFVDNYLGFNTIDGEFKPQIVKNIFSLSDMNPAFYTQTLGKYIHVTKDSEKVKNAVMQTLMSAGLSMATSSVDQLITDKNISPIERLNLLKQGEENGSSIRADALNIYLMQCADEFYPELFNYLFDKSKSISGAALLNYMLYCDLNAPSMKLEHAEALAKKQSEPFGTSMCSFEHLGHDIYGNLAQAYILNTRDSYELSKKFIKKMKAKFTDDLVVDGERVKFKKYIKDNKESLTEITDALCNDNRLYSLF